MAGSTASVGSAVTVAMALALACSGSAQDRHFSLANRDNASPRRRLSETSAGSSLTNSEGGFHWEAVASPKASLPEQSTERLHLNGSGAGGATKFGTMSAEEHRRGIATQVRLVHTKLSQRLGGQMRSYGSSGGGSSVVTLAVLTLGVLLFDTISTVIAAGGVGARSASGRSRDREKNQQSHLLGSEQWNRLLSRLLGHDPPEWLADPTLWDKVTALLLRSERWSAPEVDQWGGALSAEWWERLLTLLLGPERLAWLQGQLLGSERQEAGIGARQVRLPEPGLVGDYINSLLEIGLNMITVWLHGEKETECGRRLLCEFNQRANSQSPLHSALTYAGGLLLALLLPEAPASENLMAMRRGRHGADCRQDFKLCAVTL